MTPEGPAKVFESAHDLLAAEDVEYVVVSGWNGQIRLQSLTAGDMIEWSEANEGEAKRTAGLRLIVKSVVDSKGVLILTDTHIATLRKKSHRVMETIVKAILKLNGMNVKAETETKNA